MNLSDIESDEQDMLAALGARCIDDLFNEIFRIPRRPSLSHRLEGSARRTPAIFLESWYAAARR